MDIVICGAGEVGRHAAEVLSLDGHGVTVIDTRPERLAPIREGHDVRTLVGSGTYAEVLVEAGCRKADLFIAATHNDETNLLSAAIAKGVGAARCIARVHHSTYFEKRGLDYQQHFGIDHMVCPEYSTAVEIAHALRSPGSMAVEQFAPGRIDMRMLTVGDDAPAVDRALSELKFPRSARVATVQTSKGAVIPDGATRLTRGDKVILIAEADEFDRARALFVSTPRQRDRVIVAGGTTQGVWLCRALQRPNFALRLFESDRIRAEELAQKLDWVTVIHTDLTDPTTYAEERIDKADVFIAATDDDENNILAAARAKSLGAEMVIAVLQRPTYLQLLQHVGIDLAFSPRVAAVDQIIGAMDAGPVRRLADLAPGVAVMYAVRVPADPSSVSGRPLRTVRFPQRLIVAAIQRNGEVHVPDGDDVIQAGDEVIIIGPPRLERTLKKMFGI